jgi:hypothetical protein
MLTEKSRADMSIQNQSNVLLKPEYQGSEVFDLLLESDQVESVKSIMMVPVEGTGFEMCVMLSFFDDSRWNWAKDVLTDKSTGYFLADRFIDIHLENNPHDDLEMERWRKVIQQVDLYETTGVAAYLGAT